VPVTIGAAQESNFANPLGLLKDCHRRIERFLGVLVKVATEASEGPLNAERRQAMEAALSYFQRAAPLHTADEEEDLFPELRRVERPVDIERSIACSYCHAPIMALDPDAVEKTLRELTVSEQKRTTPDADEIGDGIVALARMESEMERARQADRAGRGVDLVGVGLSAIATFLRWS